MEKARGVYDAEFLAGELVRVADRKTLENFQREWKWHHPLETSQLPFAGHESQVENVFFYHGGEELYQLKDIPGIWHLECLERPIEKV
jgi:hypothetical protein